MIIHEDNLYWDSVYNSWCYHIENIGQKNCVSLFFTAPDKVTPRTGDWIVNNKWVSGDEYERTDFGVL